MTIGKLFIKGLLFVLPIALTLIILNWVFSLISPWVKGPLTVIVPVHLQFPGIEIIASVVLILMIGGLVHWQLSSVFMRWFEKQMSSAPVFSLIYNNLREIVDFVAGNREQNIDRVVLAALNEHTNVIGLVSKPAGQTSLNDHPDLVAVFVPMSYQMGGFLLYLPEDKLETLDMSTSDAMQLCLTADIKPKKETDPLTKV